MDSSQRLQELFARHVRRETTSEEVQELVILLGQADSGEALSEPMRNLWEALKGETVDHPVDWDRMYRQVSHVEEDLSMLQRRREDAADRSTDFSGGRHSEGRYSGGMEDEDEFDEPRRIDILKHRAMIGLFLLLAAAAAYFSIRMGGRSGGHPAAVHINK